MKKLIKILIKTLMKPMNIPGKNILIFKKYVLYSVTIYVIWYNYIYDTNLLKCVIRYNNGLLYSITHICYTA